MPSDSPTASEAPLRPPEPAREMGWLRWVVIVVALGVLALFGFKGYGWLQAYVAQRHAIAQEETPPLAEPQPSLVGRAPAASAPGAPTEPFAPAVTGEGVRACVRPDGQRVLTNQACPAGSRPEPAPAPATGARAAATITWAGDDPSLHDATCHYLTAEIDRLGYEFEQPLPPPVIDLISTRLSHLRSESAQGRCAPAEPAKTPAHPAAPTRGAHKPAADKPARGSGR